MAVGLIEIRIPQLRDLRGRFTAMADRELLRLRREEMRKQAQVLLGKLRFEAPVRTGALQQSFRYRTEQSGTGLRVRITSSVPYALIVARGSRRKNYPILPRTGKVLAMKKMELIGPYAARQHRIVFRAKVRKHPGVRADPYHVRAIQGMKPEWDTAWRRMGVRVVTQLAKRGAPV